MKSIMNLRSVLVCTRYWPRQPRGPAQQKITINYPNRSGSNWPLFLAKDGGYYQKYGLDVTLTVRSDARRNRDAGQRRSADGEFLAGATDAGGLDKDGSMVLVGSSLNRGVFALMATKNIGTIKDLKGKRIAVGQVGDAPYGYLMALLSKSGSSSAGRAWIPVGNGC